mmetsp:Transcript_8608/g.18482  ORF Transcript_8608/g.18482 Transcript_8608/m.18482 type:complete len:400 (-) Transcript_8608:62-1261(-)
MYSNMKNNITKALHSLFRNAHVAHLKRTSHQIKSQTSRHVQNYLNGMSILNISKKCNYPPSMMARLIIENIAMMPGGDENDANKKCQSTDAEGETNASTMNTNAKPIPPSRKFVTEAVRSPEKILGCASDCIIPQYLFSEKRGKRTQLEGRGVGSNDDRQFDEVRERTISRLALEVKEAVNSDPMHGPRHDRERHNIGMEYELLLEKRLRSMDIPFETEADLRARGTARTPDILLSCPVGLRVRRKDAPIVQTSTTSAAEIANIDKGTIISSSVGENTKQEKKINNLREELRNINYHDDEFYEWKIICWIDSKALYGDIETHNNSVLPQVETYVHRFGPGMVLYWFGHAPLSRLGDGHGDVVIYGGDLPDFFLMPTGDFHGRNGKLSIEDDDGDDEVGT